MRDPLASVDLLAQCPPPELTREDRIALLVEAARAMRADEPVSAAAGRFLGNALLDWLRHGGKLEHRLKVSRRGDHNTIPRIVARLTVEAADQGRRVDGETLVLSIPSSPMMTTSKSRTEN